MIPFGKKIATVIRLDDPKNVIVWWDGEAHSNLLIFDEPGFKLMFDSLSLNKVVPVDVARHNIKMFLNTFLASSQYDFSKSGPIHLDEPKVKELLDIK